MTGHTRESSAYYRIRVKGHLDPRWSEWLSGMSITHKPNGETILYGPVADQAALFGVLIKIHNLNLPLVSVNKIELGATSSLEGSHP